MVKLSSKTIDETTDLLKTISGSFRLEIICLLCSNGSMSVTEISDILKSEQSATSHQLAKLRDEDIVTATKDGQMMRYQLATGSRAKLAKKIISSCGCLK